MESLFRNSILKHMQNEQKFQYHNYSNNDILTLCAFLQGYNSFRISISRMVAQSLFITQTSTASNLRINAIHSYFYSNPYTESNEGVAKTAFFVSKARLFCVNAITNPTMPSELSLELPSTILVAPKC